MNGNTSITPGTRELLSKPVSVLALSLKARRYLEREKIEILRQLIEKSPEELLRNGALGNRSLEEIREELAMLGLHLKGE